MNIYLPNRGCFNIYHFLIYMITSLNQFTDIPTNVYIDMSHSYFTKNHNFVIEILNYIYPSATIINSTSPPPDTLIITESNFDTNFVGLADERYTHYKFLRNLLLPSNCETKYIKRIYISREDSIYRRILNEKEVMKHLELYGFQKISLTNIPLLEQFALFKNAEIIITVHGAALTNIIFCNQNTRVIEINSDFLSTKLHFEDIANCFGFRYSRYTNTTVVHNHDMMANDLIVRDIESLTDFL